MCVCESVCVREMREERDTESRTRCERDGEKRRAKRGREKKAGRWRKKKVTVVRGSDNVYVWVGVFH